jgi:outer membrane protein assembly factor BamE (lipoprotein component of BamABCDE complex)
MQGNVRSNYWLGLLAILFAASISSGCSICRAIQQPEKKDLTVLMPGNSRAEVIAEIGTPSYQENLNGSQRDVFAFRQGYTKPVKIGRAVGHGVGLFATFGLWELAGYPIELALDGEDVRVQVDYDQQMVVKDVTYFRGAHLRENGPTLPNTLYGAKSNASENVVTLTRGAQGETIVMRGVKSAPKTHDETHIADSPATKTADEPGPEPVNEATYYSSSENDRSVRASQTSGAKLR